MSDKTKAETTNAQKEIARGARMQAFLDDPDVQEIFRELDGVYWKAAKLSPHAEGRERACSMAQALDDLQAGLRVVAQRGSIQQAALARREKREQAD